MRKGLSLSLLLTRLITVTMLITAISTGTLNAANATYITEVASTQDAFQGFRAALPVDEPVTVTAEITIGRNVNDLDAKIYFLGLGSNGNGLVPRVTLTAVAESNWFGSSWRLRLEADTDLLQSRVGYVNLLNSQSPPFLYDGHTYQTRASYDPDSQEISFSLRDLTAGKEVYTGFLYLAGSPELDFAVSGIGKAPTAADDKLVTLQEMQVEQGYTRIGTAISLREVQAGLALEETNRISGGINWSDGNLRFRITRPFGRLPGVYKAFVDGGDAELFAVSAEQLEVEVNLGRRVLPPGQHNIQIVYVHPVEDLSQKMYIQEIRTLSLDVIAPTVRPSITLPARETIAATVPGKVTGEVVLSLSQPLDWLRLGLRTAAGQLLLERELTKPVAGEVAVPFTYHDWSLDQLQAPLMLSLEAPGLVPVEQEWQPVKVQFVASREKQEIESYSQTVRKLVRPDSFDPNTDTVYTYDLVELQVESDIADANADGAGPLAVQVTFTSPSGKILSVPGRRLIRQGAQQTWVARLIPDEEGVWRYQIEMTHPELAPQGIEIQDGSFNALRSDHQVKKAKRDWGTTEPMPEGKQVAAVVHRSGSTVKLEQLIGDWDSHWQIPTLNQTLSDYGYIGTDLGQSFEHNGELYFLFGDTMGTRGFIESSIASSSTVNPEAGLRMDILTDDQGSVLAIKPEGLRMAGFEVPSGGMSINGTMYFLVKDQHTELKEGQTFRSVLIRYDEANKAFIPVREFSPYQGKFAEVIAHAAPEGTPGLPGEGPYMLIWGSGEFYRKGALYLAAIAPEDIEKSDATYYFAGLDKNQKPIWSRSEADATPVVDHRVIGEFSVVWCAELQIWLLTYNSSSPRGIVFRWSKTPWGPWSSNQTIFDPGADGGYKNFMHALSSPNPELAGPVINVQPPAVQQWGGEYAPYMVERFLRFRGNTLTVYYLMSTWNPYVVVLMRSDFSVIFKDK